LQHSSKSLSRNAGLRSWRKAGSGEVKSGHPDFTVSRCSCRHKRKSPGQSQGLVGSLKPRPSRGLQPQARASAARLLIALEHVVPVDEVVDPRLQILRPGVAIVDVVGVLPNVDAENRRAAMHQRVFAVRRLHDFELAVLDRNPGPARAELRRAGVDEIGAKLVVAAEIAVDRLMEGARQLVAAAALLHPFPEMDVVEVLPGIVEETLVLAEGLLDDLLQR